MFRTTPWCRTKYLVCLFPAAFTDNLICSRMGLLYGVHLNITQQLYPKATATSLKNPLFQQDGRGSFSVLHLNTIQSNIKALFQDFL